MLSVLYSITDNCDLNLRISDDGYKCTPITVEGFAYMWAGARSNYGFKTGKVGFECKVRIYILLRIDVIWGNEFCFALF